MAGHLFVARGSLTNLACDAILVPSGKKDGRFGHVAGDWEGLTRDADGFVKATPSEERRAVQAVKGRGVASPAIWVGHTGASKSDPAWYAKAITAFIAKARPAAGGVRPLDDPRPLLAVPLVGTGQGGMRRHKGEVVEAIVSAVLAQLHETDADVVLVLDKPAAYAAAQQARGSQMENSWGLGDEELRVAIDLADKARHDRLVLFMGAGTGLGAGLPSWPALLAELGRQVKLSAAEQKELLKLYPRDAGAVLGRRFEGFERSLAEAIHAIVSVPRVSLLHQLLASLPVTEAATTNYDLLFEKAWNDAKKTHVVLPRHSAGKAHRWLLKLHGSIDQPDKPIVLSRADYLRFEGESAALAGLVQAMLLTRHILFVGYSLSDDNFHRLVHEAQSARGEASERPGGPFGTALSPDPPHLSNELWEGDVRFVNTPAKNRARDVRRLAILLDRIGLEASSGAAHILDRSYDALFTREERDVRQHLVDLERAADNKNVQEPLRRAIKDALDVLGGR